MELMQGLRTYLGIDQTSPSGLVWLESPAKQIKVGTPAFTSQHHTGYYHGQFKGKSYLAHRVVFALANGRWPDKVDHIDGNRANNDPANLRDVSVGENNQNRVVRGAHWDNRRARWNTYITVDYKQRNLGSFGTQEEARAAYLAAKRQVHPTAPSRCYEEFQHGSQP